MIVMINAFSVYYNLIEIDRYLRLFAKAEIKKNAFTVNSKATNK